MSALTVVTRAGGEQTVEGKGGVSVMEIIRSNGFGDLLALCSGSCSCRRIGYRKASCCC